METPSLGAGFSYSIQGAWSYLLQIGLDLRLFYWCGSTPITRKDQANMDYSRCKQILHDFYSENGIIDHFERDNLYLEKAFHEINEMWFRNLECIKEVKYLMIAEAPLWGKDKSYIYNPETKNTQFFQKKDLERVIGLNVYNKLDFLNYCNKMGLLIIDISPFAFNTEDTIINYRNKYNRANEMCTFYKRNVQKKDFFSRQTKSVQSVFEQRLNSRLETQNQTLFS